MSSPFDHHMKTWTRMLNEGRFTPCSENVYEEKEEGTGLVGASLKSVSNDIQKYFDGIKDGKGKIGGNLGESEKNSSSDENGETGGNENGENQENSEQVEKEAMSPAEIAAAWDKKHESDIKGFVIKSIETGDEYFVEPSATVEVEMKDGKKETKEIKFKYSQVLKAIAKLLKFRRVNKKVDDLSAEEKDNWAKDAITALVRGEFDPSSMNAWYYNNTSLDDWFANEIDFQTFTDNRTSKASDDDDEESDYDDKHNSDDEEEEGSDYDENPDDEKVSKRDTSVYDGD